jgi:N4-gp56 family major capsid protein
MARTIVGLGDAKAVKKFSGMLAVDVSREMYWERKFIGKGRTASAPIMQLTELENDAGELITYDLSMQLTQQPIEGDETQEGTEEALQFYTDSLYIDQARGGVNGGGRMTRKRTLHNLRMVGKDRMAEWWSRMFDEMIFIYMSGARGINADFIYPTTWTGRANNAITAPDASHLHVAGGHAKGTLIAADMMSLAEVDKALVKVKAMGGGTQGVPKMKPIKINGEMHYVLVMSTRQASDLRILTGTGGWLDLQKAAATAEGRNSPIFKGGLGAYNNVVLHEHEAVVRFSDYGSGSNVGAARALLLGNQAGALAYGSPGTGLRYDWHEEPRDNGNVVVISSSCIFGFKKTTYNGLDFGVMAVDTASLAI